MLKCIIVGHGVRRFAVGIGCKHGVRSLHPPRDCEEIVQCHPVGLQELVAQGHPLVVELLQASSGVKRGSRGLDDDCVQPPAA